MVYSCNNLTNSIGYSNNKLLDNRTYTNNTVTNPISSLNEVKTQNEFISKSGNQAVLSMGQAQIAKNNVLKYDTTPDQYISTLLKQGKIPNKDFVISKSTRSDNRYGYLGISEVNKEGKISKETVFITDTPDQPKYNLGFIKLYNTETDLPYKRIAYSDEKDGSYSVDEYNSKTGYELSKTSYAADGSVQGHEDCQTKKNT